MSRVRGHLGPRSHAPGTGETAVNHWSDHTLLR
jgi:hypothetical protein